MDTSESNLILNLQLLKFKLPGILIVLMLVALDELGLAIGLIIKSKKIDKITI